MKDSVTRIADGSYRVEIDGRAEIVYVAGTPDNRWAWWNGQVFRMAGNTGTAGAGLKPALTHTDPKKPAHGDGLQALSAPMPAKIVKVLVTPGASVRKGDTLIVLEAMKMELPLRATGDATVTRVLCHEGQFVQPDVVLVELS